MSSSRMAGLQAPIRHREAGVPGLNPLPLAGTLLIAGFAGLLWIGITSNNPDAYIRAVSGWLFFP